MGVYTGQLFVYFLRAWLFSRCLYTMFFHSVFHFGVTLQRVQVTLCWKQSRLRLSDPWLWLYTMLGRSVCQPVLCLAQHYSGSTSTVPTWFGPCVFILFHMLKITLKGKKRDTAEYDRVTAVHFGTAMLLCYSCTEMQTDGCSHSIKSDGLHYDQVTCICYSSLAINNEPKHVSSASVSSFQ